MEILYEFVVLSGWVEIQQINRKKELKNNLNHAINLFHINSNVIKVRTNVTDVVFKKLDTDKKKVNPIQTKTDYIYIEQLRSDYDSLGFI